MDSPSPAIFPGKNLRTIGLGRLLCRHPWAMGGVLWSALWGNAAPTFRIANLEGETLTLHPALFALESEGWEEWKRKRA